MDQQVSLPPQGTAKVAISLTAVGAGSSLGIFSTTWVLDGFVPALPLLVGGILLITLGGFMWSGTRNAYLGALVTGVGLYGYSLLGMSGLLGLYVRPWHMAALGALSVLSVAIIVFTAVYLRDEEARAASQMARAQGDAPSFEEAPPVASDSN